MPEQQWNRLYFDEWVGREGLDLIKGYAVDNVYTLPLKYWARTGAYAAQIKLDGTEDLNAAYVCELSPGRHLEPQRHLYEELVYVLRGRGSTSVWYPGQRVNSFEWKEGCLFAIPLNAWHQHFNGSGAEPARYVAVTTAPIMMNLIRNDEFIFNNDWAFSERYDGAEGYFSGDVRLDTHHNGDAPSSVATANFFADINAFEFFDSRHGVDMRAMVFEIGNGVLGAHSAIFPGGTFSKVHRHAPGAHVLWLKGEGYSLMWPEGGERIQVHWGPGSIIVPPGWWWHQQCVVSREPAQELALKLRSSRNAVNRLSFASTTNVKRGGSRMDYEDLPAELMDEMKRLFAEECARRGTPVRMDVVYSG